MNKKNLLYFGIGTLLGVSAIVLAVRRFLIKNKAVRVAKYEWEGWGKPTVDINGKQSVKGGFESSSGYSERVGRYWREGTGDRLDGRDREVPWSSAFISWVMKKAGAKDNFVYSASHSKYIEDSIANRKNGRINEAFVGYKINEVAPKVGDLVCYARQDGVNYDTTGGYKSHCDIVVAKNKNQIEVIGGNVNQSVTKKILSIDSQGIVSDKNNNWFTVIKTNI